MDGTRILRCPGQFGYSATLHCEVRRVRDPNYWYDWLTDDVQRFLELMSSVPNELFVPTLDIDLAWQYVAVFHPPVWE